MEQKKPTSYQRGNHDAAAGGGSPTKSLHSAKFRETPCFGTGECMGRCLTASEIFGNRRLTDFKNGIFANSTKAARAAPGLSWTPSSCNESTRSIPERFHDNLVLGRKHVDMLSAVVTRGSLHTETAVLRRRSKQQPSPALETRCVRHAPDLRLFQNTKPVRCGLALYTKHTIMTLQH